MRFKGGDMRKNKYKDRWELLLGELEDEQGRCKRFLRNAHKKKNYKDCLEIQETLMSCEWLFNLCEHIYETGEVL